MKELIVFCLAVWLWSTGRHLKAAVCLLVAVTIMWHGAPAALAHALSALFSKPPFSTLLLYALVFALPALVIAWLNGWRPRSSRPRPPQAALMARGWARAKLASTVRPDEQSDQDSSAGPKPHSRGEAGDDPADEERGPEDPQ